MTLQKEKVVWLYSVAVCRLRPMKLNTMKNIYPNDFISHEIYRTMIFTPWILPFFNTF